MPRSRTVLNGGEREQEPSQQRRRKGVTRHTPGPTSMAAIWSGHLFLSLPLPLTLPLSPPLSLPLFLPLAGGSLPNTVGQGSAKCGRTGNHFLSRRHNSGSMSLNMTGTLFSLPPSHLGAPRFLSVVRSLGVCWTRPFSLTVPLFGSVPSYCWCFTLSCLFSLALRYWLTLLLHTPSFHIQTFHFTAQWHYVSRS